MSENKFTEFLNKGLEQLSMGASDADSKAATETKSESERRMVSRSIADHVVKTEEGAKSNVATVSTVEPETVTESSTDLRWRAAARVLTDVSTENLWAVAKDFCNLDWCTMVTGCVLLEGEGLGNTVGTIRHCTNDKAPWYSDEKLVAIDHKKLTLTYAMVDSSLGWYNYNATLSIGRDEGKNFVELKGEQSPRENSAEQEAVKFMKRGYSVFLTDLEAKARTL